MSPIAKPAPRRPDRSVFDSDDFMSCVDFCQTCHEPIIHWKRKTPLRGQGPWPCRKTCAPCLAKSLTVGAVQ